MGLFVNRTLNMKRIRAIGFDMDYTLVRYHTEAFEELTFHAALKKLVENKNYPKDILDFKFNFDQVIQGLVIDKKYGNLLKLSRYGQVKLSFHGTNKLDYNAQQRLYRLRRIDLSDQDIQSLDTSFSVSNGVLFANLVDAKDVQKLTLPGYEEMAKDIRDAIDQAHSDGTLKNEVKRNLSKYIVQDPRLPPLLEKFKRDGKVLFVATNSEFEYTKAILEYTINPFLKEHDHWKDLFYIVINLSSKPGFFTSNSRFLRINYDSGLMSNVDGKLTAGIYQGGNAKKVQADLGMIEDEILYLGDHIYGDVVSLKKNFHWRTGLVLEPLTQEIQSIKKAKPSQENIDKLMEEKETLEREINRLYNELIENGVTQNKAKIDICFDHAEKINQAIAKEIEHFNQHFNPNWGEMMRAGQEESRFADQVEKYACVYMAKVVDLLEYSPRAYFRPGKRVLAHERNVFKA